MIQRILQLFILLGLCAALVSAMHRRRVETENQSVEIALDYSELRVLAGAEGLPLPSVLQQFRQAGAVSVALQEDTVGSTEEARRIVVGLGDERDTTVISLPPGTENTPAQTALLTRIADALRSKTHFMVQAEPETNTLRINAPYALVRGVGIGLDGDASAQIRNAGLSVIGRVSNFNNVKPLQIAWTINQLKRGGASTVLFSGDDVLGNKGYVVPDKTKPHNPSEEITTAAALQSNNIHYATVEFGKQKGDAELARAIPERVVRLHTILGSEMAASDIPGSVQRFRLAARERNIRVLFVRLFLGEANPLQTNTDYIKAIAGGLVRSGLVIGRAHGYSDLSVPFFLRAFMGLGLSGAFLLLLHSITGFLTQGALGGNLSALLVRVIAWGGAALLFLLPILPVGGYKGAEFAALACAFVFPSLGLLQSDMLRPDKTNRAPLLVALLRFAGATMVTVIGACYVVGLLADRLFLIKSESFVGVKVSELVPVLLVALVYGLRLRANSKRPWGKVLTDARNTITEFLGEPIRWWQVAAALVVLIVLALLVMRSGNDPGVGVSGLELKFRSLLDRITPARPRFKEMFGHPLLLLGLVLAVRGKRKWALPLVLAGAIGQADLLNTFCHLHTALPASIARAVLGLIAGLFFGIIAYLVLDRLVLGKLFALETPERAR